MKRTVAWRRGVALGVLALLAVGAFACGVTFGDGSGSPPPSVAETLPATQLAGERIVTGLPGASVSPRLRDAIREGRVAGVVLFAENIPSRAAGRRLVARLQAIPRPPKLDDPLLVMTDQEGGLVKRIGGAPTASAQEMGARGAAFSARQGRRTAANLRDLGINVDLAPVLDVGRPGGVIAATERSFGATPARVEATAIPFAEALQAGGVAATGKHFPGFGAATENTDFAVERVGLSKRELRAVDEEPYAAFAAAGGEMVMLSTAIYPAFDDAPAAFSRTIATAELRNRLGFDGVTVTDALETPAVEHFGSPGEVAVAGARAGADLLLFARLGPAERAWKALVGRLRAGDLDRAEFEAAAQRVLDLRAGLAPQR
ncbi:MAG TPA: glycoside hydrolase family 3 N-terminal domain-containing protein [Solirubrobacterales bacterium]|jgi:beta-N-acetylhexosaminidase|nr:glycoside hydrolase family 3 N-terminal domain-containing protein [Solirubrobacterales bacterium]